MVYLLGCLPPSGCHTGALVRALGPHGKLVPLRNADLCSTAALRLIRPNSKQPKRLALKFRSIQLNDRKKWGLTRNEKTTPSLIGRLLLVKITYRQATSRREGQSQRKRG